MGGGCGGEGERTAVAAVALGRRERKEEQGRRRKGREVSGEKWKGREKRV